MSPSERSPLEPERKDESESIARWRHAYLRKVVELDPGALPSLTAVVPLYDDYWATLDDGAHSHRWSLRGIRTAAGEHRRPERQEAARALLEALEAWARPYHLHRDDWPLEYVLFALWRARETGEDVELGNPKKGPAVAIQFPRLEPPVYDPVHQTRAEAREQWEAYADAIEEAYAASGWSEPRDWKHDEPHLEWLARFQAGERHKDIADSPGPDHSSSYADQRTPERQVPQAAETLGLTLRTRGADRPT